MHSSSNLHSSQTMLLDCSQTEQINSLASQLNVTQEVVKSAVRACCNNNIQKITQYIQHTYLTTVNPSFN